MDIRNKWIKVLLAKSDQDAHDRGVRYIAGTLRDAGMEVIFIRYRICDEVAKVALQEDVDVVGMSFYGSGYRYDVPRVINLLKEKGKKAKYIVGGTIPKEDWDSLNEMGVLDNGIFVPGIPTQKVIDCIISSCR
jgi:methylmalonyl-CoA mutase C-terminal domain/subunit